MTLDPDHGFGLLSPEDQEKMELILTERSDGSYGAPALHGMLTASVVGPKPVPMDWILQTVLIKPSRVGGDRLRQFSGIQLGGGENRGIASPDPPGVPAKS